MILNNVESIITELKTRLTKVTKYDKIDGITIECRIKRGSKYEEAVEELNIVCGELELMPISTEKNTETKNLFALQFPELNVLYTAEEYTKLYEDYFKFLFDNAILRNNVAINKVDITKALLISSKDCYVKNAIKIYCKSNINPYKDSESNYLNNVEYRKKIDTIYYDFVTEYCKENNIK